MEQAKQNDRNAADSLKNSSAKQCESVAEATVTLTSALDYLRREIQMNREAAVSLDYVKRRWFGEEPRIEDKYAEDEIVDIGFIDQIMILADALSGNTAYINSNIEKITRSI